MSGVKKISREDILNAALEITRQSSINNVQARNIAKILNCSTQPIFYQFKNMEELKNELFKKILDIYRKYTLVNENEKKGYKQIGTGYIRFAKEEPKLFQILFMSENNVTPEKFLISDKNIYDTIIKNVKNATGLSEKQAEKFHINMWVYTHGIATMIATKTCNISDEEISEMLTEQFNAMVKAYR